MRQMAGFTAPWREDFPLWAQFKAMCYNAARFPAMSIDFSHLQAQYATAAELLRRPGATAHFVGVAGVGMAGLARLLRQAGFRVSGCDAHSDAPSVPPLRALGVSVLAGHSPAHLDALDPARGDFLVRTPAADPSSPELAAAVERGLPVLDRGTVLAAFLDSLPHPLVAVCGTHGKTTTSTFATALLRALGLAPGCCIGAPDAPATLPGVSQEGSGPLGVSPGAPSSPLGVLLEAAPPAATGGPGGGAPRPLPFIAECDESDGTLALYHPAITIVGSVDFDHAEHFASEAEFLSVFDAVLSQTRRAIVYNADDARLAAYIAGMGRLFRPGHRAPETLPVGTCEDARLRATAFDESADGTSFDLSLDGAPLGRFHLPIPGRHNLLNALSAIGAIHILRGVRGLTHDRLAPALATLRLPGRRFEIVSTADGIRVIADYAHHPAELAAAIAMAHQTLPAGARLIGIFQPHRPSRTKALGPAFVPTLAGLDALALAPVYAASEPPIPGGSIADLYALFRTPERLGAPSGPRPVLLPTLASALPWLRATARPGDTILLLGAGDIISLAGSFGPSWSALPPLPPAMEGAAIEPGASVAPYCSFGVGGPVRAIAHVGTMEALRALLAWCRDTATTWRVLGAGTNFLVSDAGFDGILLRLDEGLGGPCPPSIAASLPGARLLSAWQSLGYSGLECMDGIPGTVGGWLAMNAGAQGHAVGDCLESVTMLFPDGTVRTLPRESLSLGYRTATLPNGRPLASCVILSAVFAPRERTTPEVVAERRAAFRAKRFDFRGLRTAGSVFRNPPGDSAGRILDAAGLRGLRIGGAEICPRHANIISAGPGATASDVLALVQIARERSPVPLTPEIQILH